MAVDHEFAVVPDSVRIFYKAYVEFTQEVKTYPNRFCMSWDIARNLTQTQQVIPSSAEIRDYISQYN